MQHTFPFLAVCKAPKRAPDSLISKVSNAAQAVAVSLAGVNAKGVAARLGISQPYLSQIRRGARPVPDWFVKPFCYATGTNLLAQYLDLQEALAIAKGNETSNALIKRLARDLERAA